MHAQLHTHVCTFTTNPITLFSNPTHSKMHANALSGREDVREMEGKGGRGGERVERERNRSLTNSISITMPLCIDYGFQSLL